MGDSKSRCLQRTKPGTADAAAGRGAAGRPRSATVLSGSRFEPQHEAANGVPWPCTSVAKILSVKYNTPHLGPQAVHSTGPGMRLDEGEATSR